MHLPVRSTLSALVLLAALGGATADDLSSHPFLGQEAPDFELDAVGGGSLKLSDLRGQYLVVHFGASW